MCKERIYKITGGLPIRTVRLSESFAADTPPVISVIRRKFISYPEIKYKIIKLNFISHLIHPHLGQQK